MYDLLLRRVRLANQQLIDIAISGTKIAALGQITGPAKHIWDARGQYYASAGWIDSHVHCYPNSPIYHDEPDKVGVTQGVTTVIDAGSTGTDAVAELWQLSQQAKTNVLALLNIASTGIETQDELSDMSRIDALAISTAIRRFPDFIIGLKARLSSSVVGNNGLKPLIKAKQIQADNGGLPLMVHIGNTPPDLDDIAALLTQGDILTHCFNGKPNRILTPQGELRQAIAKALERGIYLDVGHGSASFSFEVARIAIAKGLLPHTISSDIYCKNRIKGPVWRLAHVMSKFLAIGMDLAQVIDCVTIHAAQQLGLRQKGRLEVDFDADLTLFKLNAQSVVFTDSDCHTVQGTQEIVPVAAILGGEIYLTDEGSAENVLCV